jgi:hypothetical protein
MIFPTELITAVLSFIFTLLIFSYVIRDNPLFRVAVYLFIGVTAGYVAAVAFWQVIIPRLVYPLIFGSVMEKAFTAVPLLGAVFILMKISPRLAGISRFTMAFLVGAGAAVVLAGAVIGTLIPQVTASIDFFDANAAFARNIGLAELMGNGLIILAGTVTTLVYFHFGARPREDGSMHRLAAIDLVAWVGRIFIGITLGVIFAGVYAAALAALIERLSSIVNFFMDLSGIF